MMTWTVNETTGYSGKLSRRKEEAAQTCLAHCHDNGRTVVE